MFTRRDIFRLKADSSAEFSRIAEGQVLPPLHGQQGCRHEQAFVNPELSEALINSYWDTEECVETYHRTAYAEGLKALAGVLEGVPQVETFHISSSTFHKLTANRREAGRISQTRSG